jgi:hypothetical protein
MVTIVSRSKTYFLVIFLLLLTTCFIGACSKHSRQQEQGFVSLFNGKNLSGWVGATDNYIVKNGVIRFKSGTHGNLYTKDKYSNFVFRFEYKLTPNANNGVGIRAPLKGNPAYQAMEIQIIDNKGNRYNDTTAANYLKLKSYQYQGSIYGVVPAKRGFEKPAGEWNKEEIMAKGSHIRVKLNGHTIVNADLDTVKAIDGRKHPGLHRKSGHVGFLGHNDKVYFRNIRIKKLK